jgi:DNA repair exonuclease SbcCD ATPase subunit
MSKIGLYTDFHLHLWKSFGKDPKEGLPIRFVEQIDVQEQMRETFVREKCSLVIDGGDGFHIDTAIPIEVFNVKMKFKYDLHDAGIKQEIVEGNHTLSKKAKPTWINRSYYSFLDNPKDAHSPSKEFVHGGAKIKLYGYSDETPVEEIKGFDIVVVHKQPTLTNKFGYTYEGIDWRVLAKNNRLVFFGHYHMNLKLAENCWIMGPPMQLTFGDEGERGVWIVDTETWEVKFIKLKSPEFITVEDESGIKDDKNYYRVLNSKKRIKSDRVVASVIPELFEERIKSDDFIQILSEWAAINKKDKSYVDVIVPIATQKLQAAKNVFKGRIYNVNIENFFSIGSIEYRVENGFFIVTGKNSDFDSNGSGKTSLFEAIYWCFFGETTKGNLRQDEIVRDGKSDCSVSVILVDKDVQYTITRTKKSGLSIVCKNDSGVIMMSEGRTKPECQKMVIDILGFDAKVYSASCYFSQENIMMLTGLGDSDRTNMITDLLGFETYDDLYEMMKKMHDTCKINMTQFESAIASLEHDANWLSNNLVASRERASDIQKQINDKTIMLSSTNEEARVLAEQISALIRPSVDVSEIDGKIKKIDEACYSTRISLGGTRDGVTNSRNDFHKCEKEAVRLANDFNAKKKERDVLVAELQEVSSANVETETKVCSHCGSKITQENKEVFVSTIKAKVEALTKTLVQLKEDYSKTKAELEQKKNFYEQNLVWEKETQTKLDDLNERLKKANEVKNSLLVQTKEYETKRATLQQKSDSNKVLSSSISKDIERMNAELLKAEQETKTSEGKLKTYVEKIDSTKKDLEEALKNLDIYEFWREAFSSHGIRSVLLDRFCNEFNVILNQYLSLISNGIMSIVVSPTKKTGGGAERNKIGITIDNNGIERNYLALSGGEKRRVDVSLCMGLNKWVSSKYHIQDGLLGIIILDELFSFVDRLGEEAIAGLLYQEGNTRAIFVISHTPDIGSYTRNVWTVVKEKGVSSLQIEEG